MGELLLGLSVGNDELGNAVGAPDGLVEGVDVGVDEEGTLLDGADVGADEEGAAVGTLVGKDVVGAAVGVSVGMVGSGVGVC